MKRIARGVLAVAHALRACKRAGHWQSTRTPVQIVLALALLVLWGPNEANGDICGRTAGIRDLILAQLPGTACGDVTAQQLAGITTLDANNNLQGLGIATLRADDFAGLVNLEHLDLRHNDLTELPAGLFQVLNSLQRFHVDHNPETGNAGATGLKIEFEVVRAGPDTADGTPVKIRAVQGAPVELTAGVWATERELTSPPPFSIPMNRGRIYPEDPRVTIARGALESDVVTVKRTGPGQSYVFTTAWRGDFNTCARGSPGCWTGPQFVSTPLDLGVGASLSVEATPACGTTVTDTSVQALSTLLLTPAPTTEVETEYRWVTDTAQGEWQAALPITTSGRSLAATHARLAELRSAYAGFAGFDFRLKDNPGVTAQCRWQFEEGTGTGGGGTTPKVSLSASPNPAVDEGMPVTMTARLSETLSRAVTVPLVLTAGTAEPGDYGPLASITINAGATTGAGTVSTTEDADRDDETFTVALGALPPSVGAGSPRSVTVTIRDTTRENDPPAFGQSSYRFELEENRDGSRETIVLGHVQAEDPDGEAVTYDLLPGESAEWFRLGRDDGAVKYIGSGEDYEAEPNRYELTALARDPHGAEARARVVVEVLDANEPPVAGDDEATTPEDRPVAIDVLANDTDPEGDGLRVASVSAPAHGTAQPSSNGGVSYTPKPNYHGADRFTYVVADPQGLTTTAVVDVTIAPVNDAPAPVGVIPDRRLEEGGAASALDVAEYFEDVDGDVLTHRAASSDPQAVAAAITGTVLTLTPVTYGSATVTVTAADPEGLTAEQAFEVGVTDELARGVVWETLAGMARSHLASARMTLARRASRNAADDESHLSVLGRTIPLDGGAAQSAAVQMLSGWAGSAGGPAPAGSRGAAGLPAAERLGPPGGATGPVGAGGFHPLGGFAGGIDPLRGSQFQVVMDGGRAVLDWLGRQWWLGWLDRQWRVWGQGDVQTFAGAPSAATGYEGDVRTGYVGVDTPVTDDWLAGVAVSRSFGAGDWRASGARGALSTRLTAAYPYVRWSDGPNSAWATLGGGGGRANNLRETGRTGTSDLDLRLGLVEMRRALDPLYGMDLAVRADAAWAQLRTGAGEETIDRQSAAVNQVRAGAEVSRRPLRWDNGLSLSPFGELHVRRDGGAGQTGAGLEVVAGSRLAYGRLRVDAQGRLLALHSASGYRERGVGVTLGVGSRNREGLFLSVSPRWGDAATGGGTLWQEQVYRRYVPEAMGDAWAVDARGEYGVRLRSGGLLTWFGSLSQSAYGKRFAVGGRVGTLSPGW